MVNPINQFISATANVVKYIDGQLWSKTHLKLDILEMSNGVKTQTDVQKENRVLDVPQKTERVGNEGGKLKNAIAPAKCSDIAEQMRHTSMCAAKGTIYGKQQHVVVGPCHQSAFGLNKACLNTDGTPSYQAIIKMLREISTSTELKEQRLNRYFDSVITNRFYDNSLALLYTFYQYLAIMDMTEKNTKHNFTIILKAKYVKDIVDTEGTTAQVNKLLGYLREIDTAVGATSNDREMYDIVKAMNNWYDELPNEIYSKIDDLSPTQAMQYSFKRDIKVWHMYSYADGHSTSGPSFGDHYGFICGRFKVPNDIKKVHSSDQLILTPVLKLVPDSDIELDALHKFSGVMNLDGFNMKEVAILNKMLNGRKRSTPFLVDQDIDLGLTETKIRYIKIGDDLSTNFEITKEDVKSTLFKYIRNHRTYEDALDARAQLKYWLAQPGAETLEAHWWSHVGRRLVLPKPGFMRAAVPQMLAGEGISTTLDALTQYRKDITDFFLPVFESLFAVACWYWGEYLLVHNTKNCKQLLRNLKNPNSYQLQERERADALYSAITGVPVKQSLYHQVSTIITGGLEAYFNITVPFGRINLPHMHELGYEIRNDRLNFGKVVTPGCLALVTGLSGSLLLGTPYASLFTINSAVSKDEYGILRRAYNYNDLWSMGVMARWNGYDLHYEHPVTETKHKMYAANDVSIAVPPVPPYKMKSAQSYRYLNMSSRDHVFGADHEWALDYDLTLTWTRRSAQLLEQAEWNSPYASMEETIYNLPNTLITVPPLVKDYQGTITADYDYSTSVFRLTQTQAGVAMPGEHRELDSLPAEIEPLPPPPPDISDQTGQSQD